MKKIRTSKYCLVCRNLLFSMALDIGSRTLDVVKSFYYSGISAYDSHKIEFLIFSDIFNHCKIEKAAALTLQLSHHSVTVFESILVNL
jgi:hypothetical protein